MTDVKHVPNLGAAYLGCPIVRGTVNVSAGINTELLALDLNLTVVNRLTGVVSSQMIMSMPCVSCFTWS
jgi:hypothetical protein